MIQRHPIMAGLYDRWTPLCRWDRQLWRVRDGEFCPPLPVQRSFRLHPRWHDYADDDLLWFGLRDRADLTLGLAGQLLQLGHHATGSLLGYDLADPQALPRLEQLLIDSYFIYPTEWMEAP